MYMLGFQVLGNRLKCILWTKRCKTFCFRTFRNQFYVFFFIIYYNIFSISIFRLVTALGGCINASPAGKRRIAVGAEQQLSEDLAAGLGLDNEAAESTGIFSRVASPFTTITALTVAACLLVVTMFVIIFAVLQVNQNQTFV